MFGPCLTEAEVVKQSKTVCSLGGVIVSHVRNISQQLLEVDLVLRL